jgi:putative transposase
MKSVKSYTAKEIIKFLKEDKEFILLDKFREKKLLHKKECEYQIWQESFHPELIISDEMLFRKFDYIHMNPVKKGLVENPEDWRYSSAAYYRLDKKVDIIIDALGN